MTVPELAWTMTAVDDLDESGLLVLLPSLGTTTFLWEQTVVELQAARLPVRILRLDLPGHGASLAARNGFSVAELARATLDIVDQVGGGNFRVAGDSLGGCVALELALREPVRVRGLAIFCSGSRIGTRAGWAERARGVRRDGTRSLVGVTPSRWFSPDFLQGPCAARGRRALDELARVDAESYALCTEALADWDRTSDLDLVRTPTMVVAGADDLVTTPLDMLRVANALPIADYYEIPDAAHLVPLEQPLTTAELLSELVGARARL